MCKCARYEADRSARWTVNGVMVDLLLTVTIKRKKPLKDQLTEQRKDIRNMKRMISVLVFCMMICLSACGRTEKRIDKPVLEITNPKPCHNGRIIVYEQGEMVFDYKGEINIINNGRNGKEIKIEAGKEENVSE